MKGKKYLLNSVLKPFYSLPTPCFNNRQREYALGHSMIAHTKTRYTIFWAKNVEERRKGLKTNTNCNCWTDNVSKEQLPGSS
jgi:hypothetical protein